MPHRPIVCPIIVRDLQVAFRSGAALGGVDVTVSPGERVVLVGENGTGKSTLLRAVARRLPPTAQVSGTIEAPEDLFYLGQEPPFRGDATVAEVLASTLSPLRRAVADLETLAERLDEPEVAEAYAAALEYATAHDAWDADRRALIAAQRLGLDGIDERREVSSLSGGQRTRLALATAITRRPAALLLDEPTNHLDDDAVEVLVDFLRDLDGSTLVASHDRVFIDEIATDLVDLEPGEFGTDGNGGRRFGGGWTAYEEHRAAARERWEQVYAEQQEELDRLRALARQGTEAVAHNRGPRDNDKFIHAFKGKNVERAAARRKRDAQRRLDDAERTQLRKPREPLRFDADLTTAAAAGRVVQVRDLRVTARLSLDRLDVEAGGHLLVTGPNGAGKSTLLGVLGGRIRPTSGEVAVRARTPIELTQDPQFADLRRTPLQLYRDAVGEQAAEEHPLATLGLLHPRDLNRPTGALSVGQRRRLDLACAIARRPDLLLLDEPTNHLSLTLVGELEEAIATSPGTIVIASHDRWLRRRWDGEVHTLTASSPTTARW